MRACIRSLHLPFVSPDPSLLLLRGWSAPEIGCRAEPPSPLPDLHGSAAPLLGRGQFRNRPKADRAGAGLRERRGGHAPSGPRHSKGLPSLHQPPPRKAHSWLAGTTGPPAGAPNTVPGEPQCPPSAQPGPALTPRRRGSGGGPQWRVPGASAAGGACVPPLLSPGRKTGESHTDGGALAPRRQGGQTEGPSSARRGFLSRSGQAQPICVSGLLRRGPD